MIQYILRRLFLAVLTILGVMVITFLLFRVVSGDIAAAHLGAKATETQKADWRHRHGYDMPLWVNVHKRLLLIDNTKGSLTLAARDAKDSSIADALATVLVDADDALAEKYPNARLGRYVMNLTRQTPLGKLTAGKALVKTARPEENRVADVSSASAEGVSPSQQPSTRGQDARDTAHPAIVFRLADASTLTVDFAGVRTAGELIDRINTAPGNDSKLQATISDWSPLDLRRSQFFNHLIDSVTFRSRDLKNNQYLTEIIARHAPFSLALTVPAMALEWAFGLAISCFVAYYRGSIWDRLGVFLSVLGMCIPFLAFMMYGQLLMFRISPEHAFGTLHRVNLYVPITIMTVASLGGMVRFYRTIILDETGRDYVRTALAKGGPLPAVLFKHVLKNCMLPIMTSLIMSIPFLIMGSLLVENYFGISGLGDLMITSINDRNEPIMSGLVFLMTLVYTLGVLLTDISYAIFDPRIRLK